MGRIGADRDGSGRIGPGLTKMTDKMSGVWWGLACWLAALVRGVGPVGYGAAGPADSRLPGPAAHGLATDDFWFVSFLLH